MQAEIRRTIQARLRQARLERYEVRKGVEELARMNDLFGFTEPRASYRDWKRLLRRVETSEVYHPFIKPTALFLSHIPENWCILFILQIDWEFAQTLPHPKRFLRLRSRVYYKLIHKFVLPFLMRKLRDFWKQTCSIL